MRAFMHRGHKYPSITCDNAKNLPWRQQIAQVAMVEMSKAGIQCAESVPVCIEAVFHFDRPKSLAKRIWAKLTKPDLDKLLRSLFDALTGIAYRDDSQVTRVVAEKVYPGPSRVDVVISFPAEQRAGLFPGGGSVA